MSNATALLIGASSQIGIFAIPRLIARGYNVIALSRRPRPDWYPEFAQVQWRTLEQLEPVQLSRVDALVSAGPISLAATQLKNCSSVKRAVVFSTSSVFSKLESHDRHEKKQMQDILMEEAALTSHCESSGIALCLFRPTLIYGCGIDGNISWLAKFIDRFGVIPVAGEASGMRQPVHASDLAGVAVKAISMPSPLSLDVPLCGGSTLSFHDMVKAVFHALEKPERIVRVPGWLLMSVLHVVRFLPGLRSLRPEMIRREQVDLIFNDQAARQALDWDPRPFAPDHNTFELPAEPLLRQMARKV